MHLLIIALRVLGFLAAGLLATVAFWGAFLLLAILLAKARERLRPRPPSGRQAPGPKPGHRPLGQQMEAMATPALRLVKAEAPGFSKLGGLPELPSGLEWPRSGPAPRAFVAQLDLGEVSAAGGPDWLPSDGGLYFFKNIEDFGRPDDTLALFSKEPPGPAAAPPDDLRRKSRFPERRVSFKKIKSLPSLDWLNVDTRDLDLSEDELDFLADAPTEQFNGSPVHQIGGFPAEIQGGQMQIACEHLVRGLGQDWSRPVPTDIVRASKEWRLLMQIDSDPGLKMNWGDAGLLYVFIREKDARAGDFSKTVSLWQTH